MEARVEPGRIRALAEPFGFTTVGVADARPPESLPHLDAWVAEGMHATMDYMATSRALRADPAQLLPGARSVIAVTLNYRQPTTANPVAGQPRIAQYAQGRDYHRVLRGKLRRFAERLEEVFPGAQHRPCVDSAPVLEREYAHRAGLGWFGKNTMLIDSRRGSFFFIGLLLTTLDVRPDAPAIGGCGSCRRCIDACPTGAIVQLNGRGAVDARRCISYLTIEHRGAIEPELAAKIGDWTFGCDVCQDVCPFNQPGPRQPLRGLATDEPDFRQVRAWPHLAELAQWSAEAFDEATPGSPLRRAGREGLQRNAQINLANARSQGISGYDTDTP
ncbi:MAG: tRNA epoxyqueuosine(34) reductase QueG [Fimbriimonadaceae bacterium]|nr:tRNA epoxyqueuosine(34) reductase QueG [Fimbriimonadaceae bacterium]